MQCDFDTIGTRSVAADIETALVIHDLFRAIGFADFTIRVNNRMVLTGLLERLGLADRATAVLRALDKLGKIGPEAVAEEMVSAAGATPEQARQVLRLSRNRRRQRRSAAASRTAGGRQRDRPGRRGEAQGSARRRGGGRRARRSACGSTCRSPADWTITPARSSRRFWTPCPASAASAPAAATTTWPNCSPSQELPGIGASLGLDRLLAAMEELGMIEKVSTPAPVFIPFFDKDRLHDYLRLAAALRAAGIGVEVFPDPKKLGQQLKYADRRGFRVALIAGGNEFQAGVCQVKDLQTGAKQDVPLASGGAERDRRRCGRFWEALEIAACALHGGPG